MPVWLIQLLINLAVKLGPTALAALAPKLPEWARVIIEELLKQLQHVGETVSSAREIKVAAIREAKMKIKERRGVGSAPEIKKV